MVQQLIMAIDKPRDDEGRYVSKEKEAKHLKKDPISRYFSENIHYEKNKEDLLDVRVGNPLKRITDLLEDIKRQKAFSFTLKGSLGIAGVFLALSVFGIFGGGKILCDKGTQTQIGVVKILKIQETEPGGISVLSAFLDYFRPRPTHDRIVLVRQDNQALRIPYSSSIDLQPFNSTLVIATGNYDSCSHTLSLKDPQSIESL